MKTLLTAGLLGLAMLTTGGAWAKLPPPSDEAKAKAAEAAAKAAHGDKVAAYQLCKAMDRIATAYRDGARKAGKDAPAPAATPACADPGPFVYPPPAAPAAATAAAPAPVKK